jgi:hypothetical protein
MQRSTRMIRKKSSRRVRQTMASTSSPSALVAPQRYLRTGQEMKFFERPLTSSPFASISTTPAYVFLGSQVIGGTDVMQRIGRAITCKELRIGAVLAGGQTNSGLDDEYDTVRMIVAICSTAFAPSSSTLVAGGFLDPRTLPGLGRVLYDRHFTLTSPGKDTTGYIPAVRNINLRIPLHNFVIEYTGTGTNVASLNDIVLICVSDSVLAANPGFVVGRAVLLFTDS